MRAERLLAMLLLLRHEGRMTAQSLAEALGVSERTVYRDVESLSLAGIPVYAQAGVGGGIGLDEAYRVNLVGLNRQEMLALFVASESAPLADIGLMPQQALGKLWANLAPAQRDEVARLHQRLHIDSTNWFQLTEAEGYLPALQQAIWQDQRLAISYQPVDGDAVQRSLDPYGLVLKANIWYLVARRAEAEATWRIYRVGRILTLRVLPVTFERDMKFDLAGFWRASAAAFEQSTHHNIAPFGVRLRLDPAAFWVFPAYLEGRYELLGTTSEGWYELRVLFPDRAEAQMRLLALGGAALVLEPTDLGEAICATAQATLKRYADFYS